MLTKSPGSEFAYHGRQMFEAFPDTNDDDVQVGHCQTIMFVKMANYPKLRHHAMSVNVVTRVYIYYSRYILDTDVFIL